MEERKRSVVILMADDDEDDRLMAKEAFSEVKLLNDFHTVENGEELMDYLRRTGNIRRPVLFAEARPHPP